MRPAKRLGQLFATLIVVAIVALATPHAEETGAAKDAVTIVHVIDGDTFVVKIDGGKEHLRLIGIDTPERESNRKAAFDAERMKKSVEQIRALGDRSYRYTKRLLESSPIVRVEFDVKKRDKYGRLLGYLYLADGSMLNERIVADGFGRLMTTPPNVRHVERFRRAVDDARRERKGLWAEVQLK